MRKRVSIIDYGAGNIASLKSALEYVGGEVDIVSRPEEVLNSTNLILPGVGSFGSATRTLYKRELVNPINSMIKEGAVFLGICLGMQIMFERSEEDETNMPGFAKISGEVKKFDKLANLKIPHIGFNSVFEVTESNSNTANRLLRGIEHPEFYFVHSYRSELDASRPGIQISCNYGEKFLAAYEEKNIFLTQFHPEKSQTNGLRLLKNFMELAEQ